MTGRSVTLRPLLSLILLGWVSIPWAQAQDTKATPGTGSLKLVFVEGKDGAGPRLTIHVLRAMDPISEAAFQAELTCTGLWENFPEILDKRFPEAKVDDVEKVEKENVVTFSLKPGTYHVLIRQGIYSGVWLTDLKVVAGETLERMVTLEKLGSLRGTWTIDQPSGRKPEDIDKTHAALFREGRVWAFGEMKTKGVLSVEEIPPGTYTVYVRDFFEGFTSLTENVVIAGGKEATLKLAIKVDKLAYVFNRYKNKKTQADIPWDAWKSARVAFMDAKRNVPVDANYFSTGQSGQKEGWLRIPADATYTLSIVLPKFKTLEKQAVKPSRYTEKPGPAWESKAEIQPVFLVPAN
jgi:hypothetical protein